MICKKKKKSNKILKTNLKYIKIYIYSFIILNILKFIFINNISLNNNFEDKGRLYF